MSGFQSRKIFSLNDILLIGLERFLLLKNTVPWTYVISDLNEEEIVGSFYKKELQKTNQKEFRIEKILKTKGNKLYVGWKKCNDSFDSWIDKKDLRK